jgi:stage IV sporulation protein FB
MLLFIALFVYLGATSEAAQAQLRNISAGLPVSEAMVTEVKTLPAHATLDDAAEAVLRTSQHEFVVVDDDRRVIGVLMRDDIIRALRQHGGDVPVRDVMHKDLLSVQPDDPLDEAFMKMQQCACPALPVIDDLGRLVGLLTPENVGEMVILRSVRPKEGRPSWKVAHA